MKTVIIWSLVVTNTLLAGVLIGRYTKPNVAEAQAAGRPGDYSIIPCEFNGLPTGSIVVIDNVSGNMSVLAADESRQRIEALPRINVTELFDAAANRRPGGGKTR